MTSFDHLRAFVAVMDAGSLALAARRLGVSAASVTRSLNALEAHLGVQLLHRSTRLIRLTDAGECFLGDSRRILGDLSEAEATARNAHAEPQGELTVTAPLLFGRLHIAPLVLRFLELHPKVQVRTLLADRIISLVDQHFDVALRIATLPDSSLTAVRVGSIRMVVVASPGYLEKYGEPRTLEDLPSHRAVGLVEVAGGLKHWTFPEPGSAVPNAATQPRIALRANTGDVALDAAVAGHGLARLFSYQVFDHLAAGRLRRVLIEHEPPPTPVQLVYPAGLQAAAKVRAFVEFAAGHLRAHPALSSAAP